MPPGGGGEEERNRRRTAVFAWVDNFALLFPLLVGLAALGISSLSSASSSAVSLPTTCRILSSSVDLRSSQVCELGLLNYNAKHVLYHSSSRPFRCRDDYYWASIFQVEYKEYVSGQVAHAVAEAPKEALPLDCRPDFGDAWLTRLKFKVNESYNCSYTFGNSKAEIYADEIFNCTAKEPSNMEIIKRIFKMLLSSNSVEIFRTKHFIGYAMAGCVDGVLTAMFVVFFLRSFLRLLGRMRSWVAWTQHYRRICFLAAYVAFVLWIAVQYGKMIGFRELLSGTELTEKVM